MITLKTLHTGGLAHSSLAVGHVCIQKQNKTKYMSWDNGVFTSLFVCSVIRRNQSGCVVINLTILRHFLGRHISAKLTLICFMCLYICLSLGLDFSR